MVAPPADAPAAWETRCLNCGATLAGAFCGACGQRAIPPYPTVSQLASDAFNEVSGWDGRFALTFRTLFSRPGQLTLDFLNGLRARYISPIRLYLVASLAYFVTAAAAPDVRQGGNAIVETGGFKVGIFTPQPGVSTGQSTAGAPQGAPNAPPAMTPEQRAQVLASIDSAPKWMRPVLIKAVDDPGRMERSMLQAMPKVLFALLPIFAGILMLFYRGRHYPEHLYFAFHLHAFVFLALTMSELGKLTRVYNVAVSVGLIVLAWIAMYGYLSLRRVYGQGMVLTFAKALGIGLLYALASVPAMFGMIAWAALF